MLDNNNPHNKIAAIDLHPEYERVLFSLQNVSDGVITTDCHGRVEYLNRIAEQLTGWSLNEAKMLLADNVFQTIEGSENQQGARPVTLCLQKKRSVEVAGNTQLVRRDGREFSIHYTVTPMLDQRGEVSGCSLVFHDDSKLRGIEREMAYQASHDSLTGLINRWEFGSHVVRALIAARRTNRHHAFFYLDLDQFKIVNDTCGHVAGDEMLKAISSELRMKVAEDGIIARLGGDEFGILLENCLEESACLFAEELRHCVNETLFSWKGKQFEITASIGLVPITRVSGGLAEVLSAADSACYVAKDMGRNRVHLYQADDEALVQRHGEMEWTHHIRKSLEEDRFRLFRQLIQPLSGNDEAMHYEVLIRMEDEHGHIILPGEFITAAERYNLMTAIDRWVVKNVFEFIRDNTDELNTIYAINLSGQSLSEESFLDFIVEQYDRTNVDPERICFEITETAAVESLVQATNFIAILKGMGYSFALDDFGSGLSSFAYLKNLKVDLLKIDGSFVQNMADDPVHHAMVESINHIGHVMGMKTVAEFVEQDETQQALKLMGVDYVQGFAVAHPVQFL